jgi:hypothetical protein
VPTAEPEAVAAPAPSGPSERPEPVETKTRFCDDARLSSLLAEFDASERSLGGPPRPAPLTALDLEPVTANPGRFGDVGAGPGVFGSFDVDGDRSPDVFRHYSSVDYWAWLAFVRDEDCLRFVGYLEGYQVELMPAKQHGMRQARVLTYPLQGKIEIWRFDGKRYAP